MFCCNGRTKPKTLCDSTMLLWKLRAVGKLAMLQAAAGRSRVDVGASNGRESDVEKSVGIAALLGNSHSALGNSPASNRMPAPTSAAEATTSDGVQPFDDVEGGAARPPNGEATVVEDMDGVVP